MGISAVQNGLRAVSLGRKALAFRKFLPGGRRKEAGRAMQKAETSFVQNACQNGSSKYKDPPQEGQAEGTTAHQGHRACGFGGAKKIFLTKING